MSAESIRSFIQRAPWWAQPLIGLVLAAIVIVLSPLIILVAVGWCVWYGTFGEMPVDECIPYDDMRNDPEYQAFMNEVAATCDADDCPCDSCLAGGICDGPSRLDPLWDAGLDDDDTVDMTYCGMHYDDGNNFYCELIGSEQCEFCPNRR